MKFIVVTQGFKAIGLMRPNQLSKAKEPQQSLGDTTLGLDNGAALQSDTSADGAEFEYDAGGNSRLSVFFFFFILIAILTRPPSALTDGSVQLLTSGFLLRLGRNYQTDTRWQRLRFIAWTTKLYLFICLLTRVARLFREFLFCIVFCEATVSEHTMLLEGACSRPPPKEANTGPVSGVEIMRKLSKSHTHNESALRIKVHGHSS